MMIRMKIDTEEKQLKQKIENYQQGGGTSNHSRLNNLDYENSGHTGFQPAGDYIEDSNYVHTDNNFTDEYKNKIETIKTYVEIPDDVIFLDEDATHEEIMEVFGGEDAFNEKFQKMLNGTPAIVLYADGSYVETYPCYTSLETNLLGLLEMYEDGQAVIWLEKDEETNKWSVQSSNQKQFATEKYVDDKIGDIDTILQTLDVGSGV